MTLMFRSIIRSHRTPERMSCHVVLLVSRIINNVSCLIYSEKCEMKRHFHKVYIHIFRYLAQHRRVCRLIHLCTRIKNKGFLV